MNSAQTVIEKLTFIDFPQINALEIQFELKVGQCQPRFIICANLVGPTSLMLHTKSQSQWPFGSREEDI